MVNSNAIKVNARIANCSAIGAAGFKNCRKNAAKNSTAFGLRAADQQTLQVERAVRRSVV